MFLCKVEQCEQKLNFPTGHHYRPAIRNLILSVVKTSNEFKLLYCKDSATAKSLSSWIPGQTLVCTVGVDL